MSQTLYVALTLRADPRDLPEGMTLEDFRALLVGEGGPMFTAYLPDFGSDEAGFLDWLLRFLARNGLGPGVTLFSRWSSAPDLKATSYLTVAGRTPSYRMEEQLDVDLAFLRT